MKKIILILIAITCFAESQTYTSIFKLPQWQVGDTLKVRTKNDSAQSNIGLNYAFYRLEALLSNQLNDSGLTTYIKGYSRANLIIDADYNGATPRAVVINDSLFGLWNAKFSKNVLVTQNLSVGGYITTDSIILGSGVINADEINMNGDLVVGGSIYGDTLELGGAGVNGILKIFDSDVTGYYSKFIYNGGANHILTLPVETGTIATVSSSDSLQTPTIHTVLYNSAQIAGLTLNDTSANYSEWTTNSTSDRKIVRLKYVHKAGIKNVVARYYAKVTANSWQTTITVGSLSDNDTGSSSTYGANEVTTLDVSGLTANTMYDLYFSYKVITSGTVSVKELIITAESI